jgi:ankyrin repeat protein
LKLEQLLKTKQLYETSSSTSTSTSTSTITTNSADYNIGNDKINFMEQLQQLEMGQGKYSWTPLMLCCARHAPPHVIELLLQCSPQSIHISDDSGTFPLHFVCAWWNCKCSDTYKRNDNNDQEIHKSDDEESVLYSEEKLYKVLQTLLQVCPKALTYRNEWGMTPMHCIFDRGEGLQPVSIEILKLLLGLNKGNEKSVIMKKEKNRNDEKEHQRAIQDTKIYDLEENTINTHALIALSVPDSNDYLPLHTAASNGACEDILRLLLTLHPEAALTTTTDGDLPIHLLQYWAENEAKNKSFSDNNTSSRNSNSQTKSNWLYDSGVFQISKSYIFYSTQVGQIEALLEPICILRYDKSVTSASMNSTSPNRVETEEIDEGEYHQNAMKIAARLPGSRNVLLPIHIAAEHGVSFEILAALCKTYPEGVMTPQPTGASSHGSKKSLSSMGNETTPKWPHEKYPIELFESGRAGRYAEKMAHLQKIHLENPENKVLTNSTFMASSMDMNQILLELKSFDDRRDLLFAYYPDAIPSKYIEERDSRQNIIIPTIGNIDPRHAQRRKSTVLYSNDSHRIRRIEQRIRSEAILPSFQDFSITSKRLWKWMYQGVNSPGDRLKSNHQSSIGRIITDLSQIALMKLSYYSLSSSELQGDVDFMKRVPCVIQGTSILDMAKDRAAKITMSELFSKSESNWQSVVCEYLSAKDGLMFNSICTKTKGRGLRYLSESNLPETGRSWTFFSPNDREDSSMFEFWQYVDSSLIIPECTHTVIMKYYLEVSDDKMFEFEDTDEPLSLGNTKGGLMVVSETTPSKDIDNDSIERKIVASMPKLMLHPTFRTPPGFEVCLSFRYNPSLSYYVRSYGPPSGGRVSVSNARLQQVIACLFFFNCVTVTIQLLIEFPNFPFKVIYSIDRKNQTPLQVLLGNQQTKFQTPTSTQIDLITKDVDTTEYPLHLALEYGAPIEILKKLIDKNPSLLLKRNEEGCTPLHHVFLISEKIRPTIGIVNALLTTPGENAARLKDASDRLPLHIASEIGAAAAILDLLIDANTDGCYRMNRDGDLPVHLLTRSGKAMPSTVELLLAPIVDSETICGVPGSQGMELPLHIAAEYNCSYKIIERLLLSYGEAASIPRRKSIMNEAQSSQTFALDIFEANRRDQEKKQLSVRSLSRSDSGISVKTISTIATEDMVQQEMKQADFDLRSDLLFVFNPLVSNHRKDVNRIKRLQNIIRKEAMKCAEFLTVDQKVEMSEMSQLAWSFFCTFENPADPDDEYSQIVGQVLKSLTYPVVQILSEVRNPFSTLLSHLPVIDCATTKCKRLLSSRLLFAGRFKLNSTSGVIHKSKDILVINANDHGAEEAYRRFVSTFKKVEEEIKDFDDIVSCHSGTIGHVQSFGDDPQSEDDPQSLFVDFASKLGLEEDEGSKEFEKLLLLTNSSPRTSLNDLQSKEERREINLDIFRLFCETHRVDRSGIRNVAIKFMKNRTQFLREKVVRARISNLENDCYIYPIIEDFDVDRAEKTSKRLSNESVESYKVHESICDSKDGIYAMDISENNFAGLNFVSFKYAIVLPCGHKTLEDIMLHENPDGTEARNMLKTVGRTIKGLHDRCKFIFLRT